MLSTETPLSQSPGDAPEVPVIPRAGEPALRPRDIEAFRALILSKLTYSVGKLPETASDFDWLTATELAVRDRIVDLWNRSDTDSRDEKHVAYLSLEFLIGRLLTEALWNLGLAETAKVALRDLGVDLDALIAREPDAALGNGGLGRLAACFM